MADVSSVDRDNMLPQTWNIYYLVIHEKKKKEIANQSLELKIVNLFSKTCSFEAEGGM